MSFFKILTAFSLCFTRHFVMFESHAIIIILDGAYHILQGAFFDS